MSVTVGIVTKDRPAALAVTLTALAFQLDKPQHLIIVDNGTVSFGMDHTAAGAFDLLQLHNISTTLFRRPTLHHVAEGRHLITEKCETEFLYFLDDDCFAPPVTLKILLGEAESRSSYVGFIQGPIVDIDNRRGWAEFSHQRVEEVVPLEPVIDVPYSVARTVRTLYGSGTNILYRIKALRAVEGFSFYKQILPDEPGEDVIASTRVAQRYASYFTTVAEVFHLSCSAKEYRFKYAHGAVPRLLDEAERKAKYGNTSGV